MALVNCQWTHDGDEHHAILHETTPVICIDSPKLPAACCRLLEHADFAASAALARLSKPIRRIASSIGLANDVRRHNTVVISWPAALAQITCSCRDWRIRFRAAIVKASYTNETKSRTAGQGT